MAELRALSRREASIFACIADTVVAPGESLPAVSETDAVSFFDDWLTLLPKPNRAAMRTLLWAAELGPLASGFRRRLRRLDRERRAEFLRGVERASPRQLRLIAKLVVSTAQLSYYGNDAVLVRLGYDAEANLERGRRLRAAEGRP
jgi:hypothetical protein